MVSATLLCYWISHFNFKSTCTSFPDTSNSRGKSQNTLNVAFFSRWISNNSLKVFCWHLIRTCELTSYDHHAVVSRLMLGFMSGCAFLSMWVQNTSAVTMVMPIVEAVLQQILKANEGAYAGEDNPTLQTDGTWIYILFCLHFILSQRNVYRTLYRTQQTPPGGRFQYRLSTPPHWRILTLMVTMRKKAGYL